MGSPIRLPTFQYIRPETIFEDVQEVPLEELQLLEEQSASPLLHYADKIGRGDFITLNNTRLSNFLLVIEYLLRHDTLLYPIQKTIRGQDLLVPIKYDKRTAHRMAITALRLLEQHLRTETPGIALTPSHDYARLVYRTMDAITQAKQPETLTEETIKSLFDDLYRQDPTAPLGINRQITPVMEQVLNKVMNKFYHEIPLTRRFAAVVGPAQIGDFGPAVEASLVHEIQTTSAKEIARFLLETLRTKNNWEEILEQFVNEEVLVIDIGNKMADAVELAFGPETDQSEAAANTAISLLDDGETDELARKAKIMTGKIVLDMTSGDPPLWDADDVKKHTRELYRQILEMLKSSTGESQVANPQEILQQIWDILSSSVSYSQARSFLELSQQWNRNLAKSAAKLAEKLGVRYFKGPMEVTSLQLVSTIEVLVRILEKHKHLTSKMRPIRTSPDSTELVSVSIPIMTIGTTESNYPDLSATAPSVQYQHIGRNAYMIGLGLLPNIIQNVGALSRHVHKLLESDPKERIVQIDIGTAILEGDIADIILLVLGGIPFNIVPKQDDNNQPLTFPRYNNFESSSPDVNVPILRVVQPADSSTITFKNALTTALNIIGTSLGGEIDPQQGFLTRIPDPLVPQKDSVVNEIISLIEQSSDDEKLKENFKRSDRISKLIVVPRIVQSQGGTYTAKLTPICLLDTSSAKDVLAALFLQIYSFAATRFMISMGQALPLTAWEETDILPETTQNKIKAIQDRLVTAGWDTLYIPLHDNLFLDRNGVVVSFHSMGYNDREFRDSGDRRLSTDYQAVRNRIAINYRKENQFARESIRGVTDPNQQEDIKRLMLARTAAFEQAILSRDSTGQILLSRGIYQPAVTLEMRLMNAVFLSRYITFLHQGEPEQKVPINIPFVAQNIGFHFGLDLFPTQENIDNVRTGFGEGTVIQSIQFGDLGVLSLMSMETAFQPDIRTEFLPIATTNIPEWKTKLKNTYAKAAHHVVYRIPPEAYALFHLMREKIRYPITYQANQPGGLLIGYANILQQPWLLIPFLGLLANYGRTIISLDPGMMTMITALLGGGAVTAYLIRLGFDKRFRKAVKNSIAVFFMASAPKRTMVRLNKILAQSVMEEFRQIQLQQQQRTTQEGITAEDLEKLAKYTGMFSNPTDFRNYILQTMLVTMKNERLMGTVPRPYIMTIQDFITTMASYGESPILSLRATGHATIPEIVARFNAIVTDLENIVNRTGTSEKEKLQSPDLLLKRILMTHLALAEMLFLLGDGNMQAVELDSNDNIVYKLGYLNKGFQYNEVYTIYLRLLMHTIGKTNTQFTNRQLIPDLSRWGQTTLSIAQELQGVLESALKRDGAVRSIRRDGLTDYLDIIRIFRDNRQPTNPNDIGYIIMGDYESASVVPQIIQNIRNGAIQDWNTLIQQYPQITRLDVRTISEIYLGLSNLGDVQLTQAQIDNIRNLRNQLRATINARRSELREQLDNARKIIRYIPTSLIFHHLGEDVNYLETYIRLLMFDSTVRFNTVYDYDQAWHALMGSLLYGGEEADFIHEMDKALRGHATRSYPAHTMLSIATEQSAMLTPWLIRHNNPVFILADMFLRFISIPDQILHQATIEASKRDQTGRALNIYKNVMNWWGTTAAFILLAGIPLTVTLSGLIGPLIATILANPILTALSAYFTTKTLWTGIRKVRPAMGIGFEYYRFSMGRASAIPPLQEAIADFVRKMRRGLIGEKEKSFEILKRYYKPNQAEIASLEEYLSELQRNWSQITTIANSMISNISAVIQGITSINPNPTSQEFFKTSHQTITWWIDHQKSHSPLLTWPIHRQQLDGKLQTAAENIYGAITNLAGQMNQDEKPNAILAEALFGPAFIEPYKTFNIQIQIPKEIVDMLIDDNKRNSLLEAIKSALQQYFGSNPISIETFFGQALPILDINNISVARTTVGTGSTTQAQIKITIPILNPNYLAGLVYEAALYKNLEAIDPTLASDYKTIMTNIRTGDPTQIPTVSDIETFLSELFSNPNLVNLLNDLSHTTKSIYMERIVPKYSRLVANAIGHAYTGSTLITNIRSEDILQFEETPLGKALTAIVAAFPNETENATELGLFAAEKINEIIHRIAQKVNRQIDLAARSAEVNPPAGLHAYISPYGIPTHDLLTFLREAGPRLPDITSEPGSFEKTMEKLIGPEVLKRIRKEKKRIEVLAETGWEVQIETAIRNWLKTARPIMGKIPYLPIPLDTELIQMSETDWDAFLEAIDKIIRDNITQDRVAVLGTWRNETFRASLGRLLSGKDLLVEAGDPYTMRSIVYMLLRSTQFLPEGYITDELGEIKEITDERIKLETRSAEAIGEQFSTIIENILELLTPSALTGQTQQPTPIHPYANWDLVTVRQEMSNLQSALTSNQLITPITAISVMISFLEGVDKKLQNIDLSSPERKAISNLKNFLIHSAYAMLHQKSMKEIALKTGQFRTIDKPEEAYEYYFHASMVRAFSESALFHFALFRTNLVDLIEDDVGRVNLVRATRSAMTTFSQQQQPLETNITQALGQFIIDMTKFTSGRIRPERQIEEQPEETQDIRQIIEQEAARARADVEILEEILPERTQDIRQTPEGEAERTPADIEILEEILPATGEEDLDIFEEALPGTQSEPQGATQASTQVVGTEPLLGKPEHTIAIMLDIIQNAFANIVEKNIDLPNSAFGIYTFDLVREADYRLGPRDLPLGIRRMKLKLPETEMAADAAKERIDRSQPFPEKIREFLRSFYGKLKSISVLLTAEQLRTAYRAKTTNNALNFLFNQMFRAPAFVISMFSASAGIIIQAHREAFEAITYLVRWLLRKPNTFPYRAKKIWPVTLLLLLYGSLMVGPLAIVLHRIYTGHPSATVERFGPAQVRLLGGATGTIASAAERAAIETRQEIAQRDLGYLDSANIFARTLVGQLLTTPTAIGPNIAWGITQDIITRKSPLASLEGQTPRQLLMFYPNAYHDPNIVEQIGLEFIHYMLPLASQQALKTISGGQAASAYDILLNNYSLIDLLEMWGSYVAASFAMPFLFHTEINPNAPSQYPGSITINLSGEGNRPFRIHPPMGDANPAVSAKSPGSYWLMWQNFFTTDENGLPKYTFSVNPSLDMMVQLSRNPSILPYPTIGPAPSLEEAKRFLKEASASVQAATRYAGMFLSSLFTSSAEIINTVLGPPTISFVKHNLDTIVSDGKEQAKFSINKPIRNPIDGRFIIDHELLTMAALGVCEVGIADLGFRTGNNSAFATFSPLESAGFPYEPFIMGRAFRMDPTLTSQLRQQIELYFFQQDGEWIKHAGMQTLMEILNRTANPVTISYPKKFDAIDRSVTRVIAQAFIELGQQGQQPSGIRTTLDGRPATVFLIKYQHAQGGPDKTKNIIAIMPETQDETTQKLYLFVPVSNKQPATGQFLEITLPDQTSKLIEFGSEDARELISSIREALANIVLRPTQDLHTLSTMTALMLTPTPKTFINISTPDVPILEGNENILYKVAARIFREEMLEEYNEVVQKLERINKSLDPRSPDAVEVVIGVLRDKLTKIANISERRPIQPKTSRILAEKTQFDRHHRK
jgi:hypothetical protein